VGYCRKDWSGSLLDGKTIEGKDLKVEGLVARKDASGAVIQGEQLPEYRIIKPDGSSFVAEVKTIKEPLIVNGLDRNLQKAISQVKEESLRTGERGGLVRIDASSSSSTSLSPSNISQVVQNRLERGDQRGIDFVKTVEVFYQDFFGKPQEMIATVQDGKVIISNQREI
jgi:hypothetical protein